MADPNGRKQAARALTHASLGIAAGDVDPFARQAAVDGLVAVDALMSPRELSAAAVEAAQAYADALNELAEERARMRMRWDHGNDLVVGTFHELERRMYLRLQQLLGVAVDAQDVLACTMLMSLMRDYVATKTQVLTDPDLEPEERDEYCGTLELGVKEAVDGVDALAAKLLPVEAAS